MISVTGSFCTKYSVYQGSIEIHRNLLHLAVQETEDFAVSVVVGFPLGGGDPTAALHDYVLAFGDKILDRVLGGTIEVRSDSIEELTDDVLFSFNGA